MSGEVLITREPVLNRSRAITATRLVVHVPQGPQACALVADELDRLADAWPAERPVFVALAGALPDARLLAWRNPPNAMIEIPAAGLRDPATADFMRHLAGTGVPMCLDGYSAGLVLPEGVEVRFALADAAATVAGAPGLLLAKGVIDNSQFDTCIQKGFGGAAGWFFLRGTAPAKKLNPSHAQIVRLLNLVRNNADIKDIEAVLKQDVALSFKLLRYINSAGFGLAAKIQSFRHAVTMLGYEKLNRWLSLLLASSSENPAAPALLQACVARGRFMELAGKGHFDRAELDNLFITGAFSLLDTLLGVLMETALKDMHLPEAISRALVAREGSYAPFLELALAAEQADHPAYAAKVAALQLAPHAANRAQLEALAFADSMELN
jgi:EAL and modified HD-GYP domain-containing signal transduction protein